MYIYIYVIYVDIYIHADCLWMVPQLVLTLAGLIDRVGRSDPMSPALHMELFRLQGVLCRHGVPRLVIYGPSVGYPPWSSNIEKVAMFDR